LIPWFNHTAIVDQLAKWDVVYTMADKDAESVPYIPFSDVSFLKRTWRFDEEAQIWCCPLEWASIEKMLTMTVRSDTIPPEEQAAQVIASAAMEMWQYGRATFEKNVILLREIVAECRLEEFMTNKTIRTWEGYLELHNRSSLGFESVDVDPEEF
jgi:hypothetical protein